MSETATTNTSHPLTASAAFASIRPYPCLRPCFQTAAIRPSLPQSKPRNAISPNTTPEIPSGAARASAADGLPVGLGLGVVEEPPKSC